MLHRIKHAVLASKFCMTCRFGIDMQRILYAQLLPASQDDPSILLHLWGLHDVTIPLWQRIILQLMLPVLVKFVSQVRSRNSSTVIIWFPFHPLR